MSQILNRDLLRYFFKPLLINTSCLSSKRIMNGKLPKIRDANVQLKLGKLKLNSAPGAEKKPSSPERFSSAGTSKSLNQMQDVTSLVSSTKSAPSSRKYSLIDDITALRKQNCKSILNFKFNNYRTLILSECRQIRGDSKGILYWMSREQRLQGKLAAKKFFFSVNIKHLNVKFVFRQLVFALRSKISSRKQDASLRLLLSRSLVSECIIPNIPLHARRLERSPTRAQRSKNPFPHSSRRSQRTNSESSRPKQPRRSRVRLFAYAHLPKLGRRIKKEPAQNSPL